MIIMRRLRFFAATPVRGTSIEERLGVNPAGRTILWSVVFLSGITVESKLSNCSAEIGEGICRVEEGCRSRDDDRYEQACFAHKIAPGFPLKILATYLAKRGRRIFAAAWLIPAESPRLITKFNQWKAPAVTRCW